MLVPSKTVIEDTWEWLRAVLMLRPWSWLISPAHFGFVRVDNQFGNSPFCSGAAWVCFFWRMYGLPTLPFFLFPILYEELELLFADISGSDFRRGVFVETDTLLYIHYWYYLHWGRKGCVNGEALEMAFSPFLLSENKEHQLSYISNFPICNSDSQHSLRLTFSYDFFSGQTPNV